MQGRKGSGEATAAAARLGKTAGMSPPSLFLWFIDSLAPALGPDLTPFFSPHLRLHLEERAVQSFNMLTHSPLVMGGSFPLSIRRREQTQRHHHFGQRGPKQLGNSASPLSWSWICPSQILQVTFTSQDTQQFSSCCVHTLDGSVTSTAPEI